MYDIYINKNAEVMTNKLAMTDENKATANILPLSDFNYCCNAKMNIPVKNNEVVRGLD
jgi:hypothetical protein